MATIEKIQRAKVGVAGSFINQLMSNNNSLPEVGKGATVMNYTDRLVYEVLEVSPDGKTVKVEELNASHDKTKPGGEGYQNWILEPSGNIRTIVWRNNAWKFKGSVVTFTKEFEKKHEGVSSYALQLTEEQRKAVYNGECRPQNVVEGITERKDVYTKVNILFGQKDYYYDWSF